MNINGYTLKSIKNFMGREGYGFSASLYYNNKKIGEVTDTADGSGETDVYLDLKYQKDHDETVNTDFIERLYELYGQEQSFKNMIKIQPNRALYCVTFFEPTNSHEYYLEFKGGKGMSEESFAAWYNGSGKGGKIEKIDIFKSLDDFNIQDSNNPVETSSQENGMEIS